MKTIIAGSRSITVYALLRLAINKSGMEDRITEIVSGCARGVDLLGERYAQERGITVHRFPADWQRWDNRAGYRRNVEMAEYADALIAVVAVSAAGERTKGTRHMIGEAERRGLVVYVEEVPA